MPRKKSLLIELGGSHDVNLYTQLAFLKWAGYETYLATDPGLTRSVRAYDNVDHFLECPVGKGFWSDWKAILALRGLILREHITQVIFNTAQNGLVRNLCMLPFPTEVQFSGTLHNLRKLEGSFTQKVISRRVHRYFLLSRHLKNSVPARRGSNLRFEVFYPMFHPEHPPLPAGAKPERAVWIGVPGAVEQSRRDYEGLIRAMAGLEEKPDLTFLLLGNASHTRGDGPRLEALAGRLGVTSHFKFWHAHLDDPEFHAFVAACDALMPAIHPANADYEDYLLRQISGTWNLAYSYGKPLLLADGFRQVSDLAEAGSFYDPAKLGAWLPHLKEALRVARSDLYGGEAYDFESQASRYIQFITGEQDQ